MKHEKVVSVILGGGQGTRLKPLTEKRSKPAVPIAGKYRLVDIPISNCLNSKINKIFVLTQFNSASLNHHIKNTYVFDHFSDGYVAILAAEQTIGNSNWYQGTADAVRQNFPHFEHIDYEYMLILSGDQLYNMDFSEMINQHIENNVDISIATIPVNAEDATGFGIMKTNNENHITSFIEKPSADELADWVSDTGSQMQEQGKNYLASMGIYLFNKGVLKKLLDNDDDDFGKNIIPKAIGNYNVSSFQYEGYWEDIGTIKSFHEANLDLAQDIPKFNLYDSKAPIYTRARMLPPAKVVGAKLDNVLFAEGAIVHAKSIKNSLIGIRSRIGEGTVIENSYIMGSDDYESLKQLDENKKKGKPAVGVGANCIIKNAIIDKNVRIGNDVVIDACSLDDRETDEYKIVGGIVVVKKDIISHRI